MEKSWMSTESYSDATGRIGRVQIIGASAYIAPIDGPRTPVSIRWARKIQARESVSDAPKGRPRLADKYLARIAVSDETDEKLRQLSDRFRVSINSVRRAAYDHYYATVYGSNTTNNPGGVE